MTNVICRSFCSQLERRSLTKGQAVKMGLGRHLITITPEEALVLEKVSRSHPQRSVLMQAD